MPPLNIPLDAFSSLLPEYTTKNRRIATLNFIYDIAPFTTAQVLGMPTQEVEELLPEISRNLKLRVDGYKREIGVEND